MDTQDAINIAQNPQGFLVAALITVAALALALAYMYRAKERITDKFLDYVIKQNEFMNYDKKD